LHFTYSDLKIWRSDRRYLGWREISLNFKLKLKIDYFRRHLNISIGGDITVCALD